MSVENSLKRTATFERIEPGDLHFLAPGSNPSPAAKAVPLSAALFPVKKPGDWHLDSFLIIHNALRLECGLAAGVSEALKGYDSADIVDVNTVDDFFAKSLSKWVELFLEFLRKAIVEEGLAIQVWFDQAYDPRNDAEVGDVMYNKFKDLKALNASLELKFTQHSKTLNEQVAMVRTMASTTDHNKPDLVNQVAKFIASMISLFYKYLPRSEKLILQLADAKATKPLMKGLGDIILEGFRNDQSPDRKAKVQLLIRWMTERQDMKKYCDAHLKAWEVEEKDDAAVAHLEFKQKALDRDFEPPRLDRQMSRGASYGGSGLGGRNASTPGKKPFSNFIRTISGRKLPKE